MQMCCFKTGAAWGSRAIVCKEEWGLPSKVAAVPQAPAHGHRSEWGASSARHAARLGAVGDERRGRGQDVGTTQAAWDVF